MRNMSFAMTTEQIRNRTKTCTRRMRWLFAKVGDIVQPVVKGQGLKCGERVEKIGGPIRFMDVRRERADGIIITPNDCAREGFPNLTPYEFVAMCCKANGCYYWDVITRIEFEYLEDDSNHANLKGEHDEL